MQRPRREAPQSHATRPAPPAPPPALLRHLTQALALPRELPRLALAALGAPFPCPACERAPGGRHGVCPTCLTSIFSPIHLPGLVALGYYRGGLRRLVRSYKFAGARRLATPLAGALAGEVLAASWQPHLVTNIPLASGRKRSRGFDQAALLARTLASLLEVPFESLLVRRKETGEQSRLEPGQRVRNVATAFGPSRLLIQRASTGRLGSVLLVDDVHTTGATTEACRRVLAGAGAGEVKLAVVAVARKRSPFS